MASKSVEQFKPLSTTDYATEKCVGESLALQYTIRPKEVAKGCRQLLTVTPLQATERHLPYGITQCYLPPDTGERTQS